MSMNGDFERRREAAGLTGVERWCPNDTSSPTRAPSTRGAYQKVRSMKCVCPHANIAAHTSPGFERSLIDQELVEGIAYRCN